MVGPYVGHRPRRRSRWMAAQGGPQGVARHAGPPGPRFWHPPAGLRRLSGLRTPRRGVGRGRQGRSGRARLRDGPWDVDDREQGATGPGGGVRRPARGSPEPGAQRRQRPRARRAARGAGGRDRDPPDLARDRVCGRPARPARREDHRARAADRGANWRPTVTSLEQVDPDIAKTLRAEAERQSRNLELIASENFVSEAVLEAMGSVLTNKYAEGYPGRRYYGGCEIVDIAESLAIARAKELFGAEHANVQPHSGAQANMAVFFTLLKPGDTVLGPNLSHGGHLTAGSPVNYSGTFYSIVAYGVRRDTELIDLDQVRDLARRHRPKLIIAGGSAFPRAIDFKPFGEIAGEVGAALMADIAHPAGLVAAGLHPSPVGVADFVTTTTHKTLRGPRGGMVMCRQAHAAALDKTVMPGVQGGPLMHIIAAKAVAFREAQLPEWRAYQQQVVRNATALASALLARGYRLVSGGTDTHLLLVDLTPTGLTGKDAQEALDWAWITVNKNTIPYETRSPMVTSGIRIGTPAVTTRGMKEPEMGEVARLIDRILGNLGDASVEASVRGEVQELTARFPLYPERLG